MTMVTIGWGILLLILIIALYLDGVALGLLSGLVLTLLTIWIQPSAPPNDLMLLYATWLLLMATLEATGFFYLMAKLCRALLAQAHYGVFMALLCYAFVFLTGDKAWLAPSYSNENRLNKGKYRLLLRIAGHMALLGSPLSISGILLIVVAGNNGLPIVHLVAMVIAITLAITIGSSCLVHLIPDKWLLSLGSNDYAKDQAIEGAKNKIPLIFLLLLLSAVLFLSIQPQTNRLTGLIGKIFPLTLPIFCALVMLSLAAVIMLSYKVKPAKIVGSQRFQLGIQSFFVVLGLTWLVDTLISYDKAYLIKILSDGTMHYSPYLLLYMLLIDIPMLIWLFSVVLIEHHCTMLTLVLWLILVHSLTPIKSWIRTIIKK